MLVVLPVIVLLISALSIEILQRIKPSYGVAWLISISASVVVWGYILALRWIKLLPFVFDPWKLLGGSFDSFGFQVDEISWAYAFCLASLLLGVILTASARLQFQVNQKPGIWRSSLVVTALGLLAVFSNTPLVLVFAWTLIDVVDFVIVIGSTSQGRIHQQSVVALASRVFGSVLVVWAIVQNVSQGVIFRLSDIRPETGVYLLLGAGLRLGVFPLHLPYSEEVRLRRGMGTVIRLTTAATSLAVLSRLPAAVVKPELAVPLLILTSLAAIYGAIMWYSARNELDGRPYWVITLAALAVGSVIRGQPMAAMTWGITLVLSGGLLFLYSYRMPVAMVFPLLGLLGLSGLPFSPAASGWPGLIVLPFSLLDIFSILAHSIVLVGYLRHGLRLESMDYEVENWVRIIYPIGLGVICFSQWTIGIVGWSGSFTLGIWWGALVSIFLAIIWYIFLQRRKGNLTALTGEDWLSVYSRKIWMGIASVLNLGWLYRLLQFVYNLFQSLIQFTASILEGDGGVLWALLLLALLTYLIIPGGAA